MLSNRIDVEHDVWFIYNLFRILKKDNDLRASGFTISLNQKHCHLNTAWIVIQTLECFPLTDMHLAARENASTWDSCRLNTVPHGKIPSNPHTDITPPPTSLDHVTELTPIPYVGMPSPSFMTRHAFVLLDGGSSGLRAIRQLWCCVTTIFTPGFDSH
jgi:hypothetical protein